MNKCVVVCDFQLGCLRDTPNDSAAAMAPPLFLTRMTSGKAGVRKIKPTSSNGSGQSFLSRAVTICFCLCFLTAIYLIAYALQPVLLSTKTLAGDNLRPTPWHHFPHNGKKKTSLAKMFHCSFLSCALRKSPPKVAMRNSSSEKCPDFFSWIHEDLSPWRKKGITRRTLERAAKFAAFRVVIVDGKLYTDLYYHCVQSRAMFTIWGLLMLLERYPGLIPDVEFMFNCMDRPHFFRKDFQDKKSPPPPLFAYCGTKNSFDIPFPDWSYWGWAEVNIGPWEEESVSIFEGSKSTSWNKKQARAYWKGNPNVGAQVRTDLLACNRNETHDFGADIHIQNWNAEAEEGYKNSKLSNQCGHRYKIYAEGHAWSVSFKYIMSCGSTLLLIDPEYHDFFMRGLVPHQHYWPIDHRNICPSIKQAVEWGNAHSREAEDIGKQGQEFLRKDLSMDRVYDHMLHLLSEYAKLQKFQPSVPDGAQLVCKESVLCIAEPLHRKYLEASISKQQAAASAAPCWLGAADHGYIERLKQEGEEMKTLRGVREMVDRRSFSSSKPEKPHNRNKRRTNKRTKPNHEFP